MKPTVIYEEHDGQKIITGFGQLIIEPIETQKKLDGYIDEKGQKVVGLMSETPEFKTIEEKKKLMGDKHKKAVLSWNSAVKANKSRNQKTAELHEKDWRQTGNEVQALMDELPELNDKLKAKRKEMFAEHAVYFKPRDGEEEITPEEIIRLVKLYKNRTEDSLLTVEGKEIMDIRGTQYFLNTGGKWEVLNILRLGEKIPPKGKIFADLTPSEAVEVERAIISGLTTPQKAQRHADALATALSDAKSLRNDLEIKKTPSPLSESQKWYADKLEEINYLYS